MLLIVTEGFSWVDILLVNLDGGGGSKYFQEILFTLSSGIPFLDTFDSEGCHWF